jgi:Lrp/AsnC family transcriptional regulator, regulator for asnA, asnC and gidA
MPSVLVDDLDKKIIEHLQDDGRRTFVTIGRSIGLSEAAVRVRVRRLQDAGVLQIVAVTDPVQLGFTRLALLGIRTVGDLAQIADELAGFGEVDYLVIAAGSFDLMAEVICRDDEHLLEVLHAVRAIKGVIATEAFVYLHIAKEIYNWGTA